MPLLPSRSSLPCYHGRRESRESGRLRRNRSPTRYPTTAFGETDWEMWRGVHRDQGITDVSKFYTQRNLWAMARLWSEADKATDEHQHGPLCNSH